MQEVGLWRESIDRSMKKAVGASGVNGGQDPPESGDIRVNTIKSPREGLSGRQGLDA